jgi:hypothetical protein
VNFYYSPDSLFLTRLATPSYAPWLQCIYIVMVKAIGFKRIDPCTLYQQCHPNLHGNFCKAPWNNDAKIHAGGVIIGTLAIP